MGWNNGRGWSNNNGGYNNNRGYNDRGYDNRNNGGYNRNYDRDDDRGYNNNRGYDSGLRYDEGTKCTLTYNNNKTVIILRKGREQYECRDLETLRVDWFYEHELEPVQE